MADDVTIKFGADIADLKGKVDEVLSVFGGLTSKFAEMAAVVGGGVAFKKFIDETNKLNGEAMKLSKMLGITGEAAGTLNTALGDIGSDADTYTGAFLKFTRQLQNNSEEMRAMGVDVDALKNGTKDSNQVFQESIKLIDGYRAGQDQARAAMKLFGKSVEEVQALRKLDNQKLEEAKKKNQELNLVITQEGVAASKAYKLAMNDVDDVLHGVQKTIGEGVMPHFTEMAMKLASIGPVIVEALKPAVQTLMNVWNTLGETIAVVWNTIKVVADLFKETWQQVFGKDGPGAMEIFNNVLKIIEIAFVGLRIVFELSASALKTGLTLLGEYFVRFANVAERALHLDFAGAKAAWKSGIEDRNNILDEGMRDAVAIAEKGQADIEKIALRSTQTPTGTPMGGPKGGARKMDFKKAGGDEEKLAATLALQKAGIEAEKNLELEYLKEAQSMYDDAFKKNLISIEQFYSARLAIELKGIDASLDAKRKELAKAQEAEQKAEDKKRGAKPEERNKLDAQVTKFKTEQVKLLGDINVLEAQRLDTVRKTGSEQAEAERKLNDDLTMIRATRAKAGADAEVAAAAAALAQKKGMRQIDANEEFAGQRSIEDRSYAATQTFLAAKRALIHGEDKKALEQQAADEEAAELAHQAKLTQIERAAVLERTKYNLQMQDSVQSNFATMISDMLSAQKKLGDVLRNFAVSIAKSFEDLIAKRFAERLFGAGSAGGSLVDKITKPFLDAIEAIAIKWGITEAVQTTATEAGGAARTAAKIAEVTAQTTAAVAGSAAVLAAQQATSIAGVLGWASTAAAAAMASVAAIPFYGWAMAPAVGAATYTTALGYLATAEGGWDSVPFDGAMAQLHKKEMVLPRFLSEGVRQMAEPGALQAVVAGAVNKSAPAAGGDTHAHFHITAMDTRGVKEFFNQHGGTIVDSLKKQERNFAFKSS